MKYDLEFAKKQVADLEHFRIVRALSGSSEEFQHVFQLVTLLLHLNYPNLPGFVADAPVGICHFKISDYQQNYLTKTLPELSFSQIEAYSYRTFDAMCGEAIYGIYVMGSIASISQTSSSDMDIWVCHREDLSQIERERLAQKARLLEQWARQFDVEMTLFLMDQERFRCFRYSDALTSENCGSAQYMLLLDEFYRSAIRLAGKPLLWLHLLIENEKDYEAEVEQLILNKEINLQDWVDFGGLGAFSANEYFGASLWHLYKGIDAPYKSLIKILLLEAYSWEYPNTYLISSDFKFHLLTDRTEDHHFDPYLAMLERVTAYLTYLGDFKRLDFVRRCFYVKATEDLWYTKVASWRYDLLAELAQQWGWSQEQIEELNQRPFWKIKQVKKSYNTLVKMLMLSYRNLINFARKHNVDANIMPQDISILSRKLYSAFEELPGKVTLVNPLISNNLSEDHLMFIEVNRMDTATKAGWYLVNQSLDLNEFSSGMRHIEYNPNLHKLVAWAYFNGLLTANTQLYISSQRVSLAKLKAFIADLSQFFPVKVPPATNEELHHPCEIRHLAVLVNLVSDPTQNLAQPKGNIQQGDLFSFGPNEESLVGSIDLIYRNLWNEIRTLHFEGPNAILLALKVLSNKIHRGSVSPQSVDVFCYSEYYQRALKNLVQALVSKCISIQVGTGSVNNLQNVLRVAGKNWQFFFEERGMRWYEMPDLKVANTDEFADTAEFSEKAPHFKQHFSSSHSNRKYPAEIDAFASEGFLQFFFKDNTNGSFDVYILDEQNHIEIYRHCDGEKEQKIKEINYIYQQADSSGNNPYHIVQRDFNYPQFYQIIIDQDETKIVPFHHSQRT
ncbi:adenylate cyclase [Pasteurellaceae bacterium Pebbles2]|nr:adenylate cyclase [Pasteurellaceae bacterium Pebbles2]